MTSIDFDLSGNMKMKTDAWPANTARVDNQMNYPAVYLDNQKQVNQWPPLTRLGVFNGFENNFMSTKSAIVVCVHKSSTTLQIVVFVL